VLESSRRALLNALQVMGRFWSADTIRSSADGCSSSISKAGSGGASGMLWRLDGPLRPGRCQRDGRKLMPWASPRSCAVPGCPRTLLPGERCPEHQRSFASSTYRRGRPLQWERVRRGILRRDHGLCVAMLPSGQRCGARANQVDHIVPRSAGGSDEMANLQSLCLFHHQQKTAVEANAARRR
jgi:5-methylcytosine-specific restriction protein A